MSQITQNFDLSAPDDIDGLKKYLAPFASDVIQQINGNLQFGANINAAMVWVNFPNANTNVRVTHTLNTTPSGYWPVRLSAAGSIYDGSGIVLGTQFANLKSSASGMTALIMFF